MIHQVTQAANQLVPHGLTAKLKFKLSRAHMSRLEREN